MNQRLLGSRPRTLARLSYTQTLLPNLPFNNLALILTEVQALKVLVLSSRLPQKVALFTELAHIHTLLFLQPWTLHLILLGGPGETRTPDLLLARETCSLYTTSPVLSLYHNLPDTTQFNVFLNVVVHLLSHLCHELYLLGHRLCQFNE